MGKNIHVDVMTPKEFSDGVKLDKFTMTRHFAGNAHPLKQIHAKIGEYVELNKKPWEFDVRHAKLLEIAQACNEYLDGKGEQKASSKKKKYQTIVKLQLQATNRVALEEARMALMKLQLDNNESTGTVRVGGKEVPHAQGKLLFERLNKPGAPAILGDELVTFAETEYGVALTGDLGKDWLVMKKILKDIHNKVGTTTNKKGETVPNKYAKQLDLVYMSPPERKEVRVHIENDPAPGTLTWGPNSEPLTTLYNNTAKKWAEWLYAASPNGKLYTADGLHFRGQDVKGPQGQLKNMRHSTFLGGGDALCAGCMRVVDGRLIDIDNNSGHYAPKMEHLLKVCELIVGGGYDPGTGKNPATDGYVVFLDWEQKYKKIENGQPSVYRVPIKEFLEKNGIVDPDAADVRKVSGGQDINTLQSDELWWVYTNQKKADAKGYKTWTRPK